MKKKNCFTVKMIATAFLFLQTGLFLKAQTCGSFAAISNGAVCYHTAGIKTDGTLWTWGYNSTGQLGNGNYFQQYSPVQVGTASNWWQAATGGTHTLAIKRDSTLWAWGDNSVGQLGDGTLTGKNTPVQIAAAFRWIAVCGGQNFSVAIRSDGSLWAWGNNSNGELGDGTTTSRTIPVQVGTATDWVKICSGLSYTLGIRANGSLWAWGSNAYAQLGDGTIINRTSPVPIAAGSSWQLVACGQFSSLGIKSDGSLWGWGDNGNGQLGIGNNFSQILPVRVGTGTNWKAVTNGAIHSIALKNDGTMWAWGDNGAGQLGDGTTTMRTSPVQIAATNSWAATGTGATHSCAIRADGSLYTWGLNFYGMLGNGTTSTGFSPSNISNNNTLNIAMSNTTQTLPVVLSTTFFNGVTCTDLITTVTPAGAAPVNGYTMAKVLFENTQPPGFVKRHYEIVPAAGTNTATANVILYFTQQEFDAFNAVNTVKLPVNPLDAAGIANLLIEKRNGASSDFSGLPYTYPGNAAFIDPPDNAVQWNAVKSRWEVTVAITGMGGFFAGTSRTLNFNNCPGSVQTISAGAAGTVYQWQADSGAGFTNLSDGGFYNGTGTSTLTITGLISSYSGTSYRCVVDGVPGSSYTVTFAQRWLGNVSNDWFNGSNWSGCGNVPDAGTDVIIPGGRPNYPVINGNAVVRSLVTGSGASVTVQTGSALSVMK